MATPQKSLIDETRAAARGCIALLVGDRRAADYFDFSQRGIVGSFIALLVTQAVTALVPILMGSGLEAGDITRGMISVAIQYAAQIACIGLLLNQIGRLDGFGPYIVADNWTTSFATLVLTLLAIVGLGDILAVVAIALVALVIVVNIARLIVTLSTAQVVLFMIAYFASALVGFLIVRTIFPDLLPDITAPPETTQ